MGRYIKTTGDHYRDLAIASINRVFADISQRTVSLYDFYVADKYLEKIIYQGYSDLILETSEYEIDILKNLYEEIKNTMFYQQRKKQCIKIETRKANNENKKKFTRISIITAKGKFI